MDRAYATPGYSVAHALVTPLSVCVLCGSPAWPSPPVVGPLWVPPLWVGALWVGPPSCRVRILCGIYSRDV